MATIVNSCYFNGFGTLNTFATGGTLETPPAPDNHSYLWDLTGTGATSPFPSNTFTPTPGNTLVLAIAFRVTTSVRPVGVTIASIDDGAGKSFVHVSAADQYSAPDGVQTDIWYLKSCGSSTDFILHFGNALDCLFGPIVVYELNPALDLIASGGSHQDTEGISQAIAAFDGPSLAGGANNFYVSLVKGRFSYKSVTSPWVEDFHSQLVSNGDNPDAIFTHLLGSGTQQANFTQLDTDDGEDGSYAVGGAAFGPAASPGNIIIRKTTVPSGVLNIFTFTPSYGSPFTLTDGGSNDSGPLTAGTYSVVETPLAGWDTSVSQNPAAIIVTDGVTVTITFTNTPSAATFTPGAVVPWLLSIEDHLLTINDLDGDADLADLIFNVQDRTQLITADFPSFVFEGKRMRLLAGFDGMARSDFVTLFTGRVDSIESANANMEYVFTNPDVRQELTRTIYTVADDGFPTDSSHVRTINGNPLDILIAALENEVGLAPGDIDLAKILAYRNSVYNGVQMEFKITSPPVAKDFIANELMKPLAAYIWPNNLGQVSVNFYYPLSPLPVFDFNRDNLVEIPEAGPADLINEVSVRLDYDLSDSPKTEIVREDAASVAKFGLYGNHIIEAKGLRSGLQGAFFGALAAWLIFLRYSFKQLMFGSSNSGNGNANPINALWSACLVEPGDISTLTHPQVPDRNAGVMGVTGKTFAVMDRQWQFFPCLTQLKLLETDLSKFKQYLIAPNGEAVYTAAGTDQGKYMFLCGDSDQYSNGDPGNTLA